MRVKDGKPMAWTSSAETARFRRAMEEQARQQLAQRLKQLRAYKGMTAPDLAHESGVSARTISRLETAQIKEPREETIRRLAKTFGMTRDDLVGPRLSLEEVDELTQTQLDRMEARIEHLADLLTELLIAVAPRRKRKPGSGSAAADDG